MPKRKNRVVITGLGVTAPNGLGITEFETALERLQSGIRKDPELESLGFGCQISGTPQITEEHLAQNFTPLQLRGLKATGIVYGVLAGKEAFADAGYTPAEKDELHSDIGLVFGTGQSGGEKFREAIHLIDEKRVRRLGSTSVIQTMTSGISAWLAGELGLGNQVTSNSSACSTGTEALLMGYERIASGKATGMLVGSTSDSGPYIWGGFDAMRILPTHYNNDPTAASRPMSDTASGFVPSSGAGALFLENLENAEKRNATIYAEVLGGKVNCGGQRNGGTMTAPNSRAVQDCIIGALEDSKVDPEQIDAINGHLTATGMDATEIQNWSQALNRSGKDFPMINSFKGLIGHPLAAAGSIELVACALQIKHQKIYGNCNINPLKPEIEKIIDSDRAPEKSISHKIDYLMKASFGFGDVNACVVLKRFT